jgi:hypothetical protein
MKQPQHLLRPDHLSGPCIQNGSPSDPVRTRNASAPCGQEDTIDLPDDPGRLIENAFMKGDPTDDPETYILAWLAISPQRCDAPAAANTLMRRLLRHPSQSPTRWQMRLLDLLAHIAACPKRRPGHRSVFQEHQQTKGKEPSC